LILELYLTKGVFGNVGKIEKNPSKLIRFD